MPRQKLFVIINYLYFRQYIFLLCPFSFTRLLYLYSSSPRPYVSRVCFFLSYIFASSLLTPHLLWSLFALFVSELFINLVCVLFYRFLLHYSSTSAFSLYPSVSLVYIIIFLPSVTLCFLYLTRGFGVLSMFLCLTSSLFLSLSTLPSFIFENCLTLFK